MRLCKTLFLVCFFLKGVDCFLGMKSVNWKMWKTTLDLKTCLDCKDMHGKIYQMQENIKGYLPMHIRCRCVIEPMKAIRAGRATKDGAGGADIWLKVLGKLPPNYISYQDAKKAGWENKKGNLNKVVPGKMLARGRYWNRGGHLPETPWRIWYEADINYKWGFRGNDRILYSNDGLIFVTYDHYKTFIEIV